MLWRARRQRGVIRAQIRVASWFTFHERRAGWDPDRTKCSTAMGCLAD